MTRMLTIAGVLLTCAGCVPARPEPAVDLGLAPGYSARAVQTDLNNPSCVTFSPRGELTVVDSGNGAVFLWEKGQKCPTPIVTGFVTEHWKTDPKTGRKRFKLGPLSAVWVSAGTLAVTDAGRPDGQDTVNFYANKNQQAGGSFLPLASAECVRTNPVGPTTKDPSDHGEGNFTGMCLSSDGAVLYVCSHGSDQRTWVLACDVRKRELKPALSADASGIAVNAPMQALYRKPGWLYVLYSGEGGKEDGLLVQWDLASGKPAAQWKLPGLVDPMGMAFLPGSEDELAVVDNNWSPTAVRPGRLARVKLVPGKDRAEVRILGDRLLGPVSCAFSPQGELYVAQLGEAFDSGKGSVVAISGFVRR
jgi:WD40 repeat protein